MQAFVSFAVLLAAAPAVAFDHRGQAFLAIDGTAAMRPEEVAEKLVRVEDRWEAMAISFVECMRESNSTGVDGSVRGWGQACDRSAKDFTSSCVTVVGAMVQGSSGQRDVVKEYMQAVCSAGPLKDWRRERCQLLAAEVGTAMSDDSYSNRESLNLTTACRRCWAKYTVAAQVRYEAEEKTRAEEEAKAAAERQKAEEKRAAEAAASARQRAADAQAEAEAAAKNVEEAKAEEAARKARAARNAAEEAQSAEETLTGGQNATGNATATAVSVSTTSETTAPNVTNETNATLK